MLRLSEIEKDIQKFWQEHHIFRKSLNKKSPQGDYIFYDGPPFATGAPHYGHIVASIMKDIVPRYWTMRGYHVERKWGWDCHGLPIENIVERELNLKSKKDIYELGIAKFNQTCQSKVLLYAEEWRKVIDRLGRWVDMDNDYKTMDVDYMETIWWVFKELWDKGYIYQGYKSMHICPRCETTLSQSEVSQAYEEIDDLSVIAKFKLIQSGLKLPETEIKGNIFVLAWTTTPWTLPGNVALAVGTDIQYAVVKNLDSDSQNEIYILAKENLAELMGQRKYETLATISGKDLVGYSYEPLFNYFKNRRLDNISHAFKIYSADFVSLEDGTGVVHIAPAFGEDDMNLGKQENLPFIQHVNQNGHFVDEVVDFAGLPVKPKTNTMQTDEKVVAFLKKQNLVFDSQIYSHSYPHCWRCDTPLLNYATSSWFVNVIKIKEKMLDLADQINWVPLHIKHGRFGNWLEGARDWSISRQRFWGSVMPIWQCQSCQQQQVIGSIEELHQKAPHAITKVIIARHAESEKNIQGLFDSDENSNYQLTAEGLKQAKKLARHLSNEKNVVIYSSPLLRARKTAQSVAQQLGSDIIVDQQLTEVQSGSWDGLIETEINKLSDRQAYLKLSEKEQFTAKRGGPEGESWQEVEQRLREFFDKKVKEHTGQTVIMVGHQTFIYLFKSLFNWSFEKKSAKLEEPSWQGYAIPHTVYINNNSGEPMDLHKHIVDKITFSCSHCQGEMRRIDDVLDCWFESGSMPYAQMHYPFENKERFERNFPAEFIGEGVDQTRAWFYYLHVLATAIQDKPAYKNVIANGIVLAKDGKKMSKKLQNYPDPTEIFKKYGADALRYYLTSSQVMKADDLNFSEKDLTEQTRFFNTLFNVVSFYQMFVKNQEVAPFGSFKLENILDRWIVSRLAEFRFKVTQKMNHYDLHAIREIPEFINDLSTWYIRRSRERFKSGQAQDKVQALSTLKYVLNQLALVMAPFMPFTAEYLYQQLGKAQEESIHLADWPTTDKKNIDQKVLDFMRQTRKVVELGLSKRTQAGIKVRQPLAKANIKNINLADEYLELIKDELNLKSIEQSAGSGEIDLELDTHISSDLKQAGLLREFIRTVNQLRKKMSLTIDDKIILEYSTQDNHLKSAIEEHIDDLRQAIMADEIKAVDTIDNLCKINEIEIYINIKQK